MNPVNAFTVDVEDYFQVSAFERQIDRSAWPRFESRVEPSTRRILDLCDRQGIRGTFFVLGWVAQQHPDLIRDIHARGHEIGSHSFWHRLVYTQSPQEFRTDLLDSRAVLEDLTGTPVRAYRAPSFSITARSLWALEILAEEGFDLDSSIFPVHHDRYGIPGANPNPHRRKTESGELTEFPASVVRLAGLNFPVAGGGYFRLYPLWLSLSLLRRVNERHHRPFVFYIHPWEVDPEQPRLNCGSRLARQRHYVNLHRTVAKLEVLMSRFNFAPLGEVARGIHGREDCEAV
jgi:polysaccharide deacetylase family protein (PEP-CTERM system associated)